MFMGIPYICQGGIYMKPWTAVVILLSVTMISGSIVFYGLCNRYSSYSFDNAKNIGAAKIDHLTGTIWALEETGWFEVGTFTRNP
jgi:hypothetical protein